MILLKDLVAKWDAKNKELFFCVAHTKIWQEAEERGWFDASGISTEQFDIDLQKEFKNALCELMAQLEERNQR